MDFSKLGLGNMDFSKLGLGNMDLNNLDLGNMDLNNLDFGNIDFNNIFSMFNLKDTANDNINTEKINENDIEEYFN